MNFSGTHALLPATAYYHKSKKHPLICVPVDVLDDSLFTLDRVSLIGKKGKERKKTRATAGKETSVPTSSGNNASAIP